VKTLVAASILTFAGMCFASFVHAQDASSQTVHYHATIDTVKYVYATAPPVAHFTPATSSKPTRSIVSATPLKSPVTPLR
jgi:hypothetical protein